jgi:hypothetical protein
VPRRLKLIWEDEALDDLAAAAEWSRLQAGHVVDAMESMASERLTAVAASSAGRSAACDLGVAQPREVCQPVPSRMTPPRRDVDVEAMTKDRSNAELMTSSPQTLQVMFSARARPPGRRR